MATQCVCPPTAELPDLGNSDCDVKLDLIVKIQLARAAGGSYADITDETELDNRLGATVATKVVLTPNFADTDIPGTEIILTGQNDNTSPFGEGFRVGETSTTFTATFANLDPAIKDQLKAYECYTDLVIAMYDAKGKVISLGNDLIPISNFFVGSRQFGGRTEKDLYTFNFTLPLEWDNGLTVNALTYDIFSKVNS